MISTVLQQSREQQIISFCKMLAIIAMALMLPLALTSCNSTTDSDHAGHDHGEHNHEHEHDAPAGIQWPELSKLDNLMHRIKAFEQAGNFTEIQKSIPTVQELIDELKNSEAPEGMKNEDQVRAMLDDIYGMKNMLGSSGSIPNPDMIITNVLSVGVIVEKIMETSGMPHVHETLPTAEEVHDHDDHSGHDH